MKNPQYGKHIDRHGVTIEKMISDSPAVKSIELYHGARKKLGRLAMAVPDKKKPLVFLAISILKRKASESFPHIAKLNKIESSSHILTDHGFIRGLERIYGLDIKGAKDFMIEQIKNHANFEPVIKDEKILTIIPNRIDF